MRAKECNKEIYRYSKRTIYYKDGKELLDLSIGDKDEHITGKEYIELKIKGL